MNRKLIAVALITLLLSIVLGSNICCTGEPVTQYDLTTDSTDGGSVTTPGEGTYTYDEGEDVSLVATPDSGYHFVKWTGDVGTIADDEDATTITMNGDYSITANFGFDMTFIDEVPDTNQPPTNNLVTTIPTNYCAPMAMVNITYYWDVVMGHANAQNVNAGLPAKNVTEYIGYFMDTNNTGSPDRANGTIYLPSLGTYAVDISPGTSDFVRWDATHPFPILPDPNSPALPLGKLGYAWTMTDDYVTDASPGDFAFYKAEIDAGRPLVVCFKFWHPVDEDIAFPDPETGETIDVFSWGAQVGSSEDPDETWNLEYGEECIGHAVTGVGYILNWDPDGSGPLGSADYVIVHDNWSSTPENVAIPWAFWNSSHAVDPGP
jgi:hypothetical protein